MDKLPSSSQQPWREVSGELTDEQKALGWPWSSLSGHTEAKAVTRIHLQPGQTMTIIGERPPCPLCRSILKHVAQQTSATIHYQWRSDGTMYRWTAWSHANPDA